jgi:predicted outer membrane protein
MIKNNMHIIILIFCLVVPGVQIALAQIPLQESDGEILGLSSVIEESEVQEAYLAMKKNINKEVSDYARMLNQEIGEHLKVIQNLSKKLDIGIVKNTTSINHVRNENQKDLAALELLDGVAFAQLFMTDTIKGHTEVLNWIDSQSAQNAEVNGYLKETRTHVAKNLDKAIIILKHQTLGQI